MVRGASVLRQKGESSRNWKTSVLTADRARRVAYTEYSMPPLGFLNEAPPLANKRITELLGSGYTSGGKMQRV